MHEKYKKIAASVYVFNIPMIYLFKWYVLYVGEKTKEGKQICSIPIIPENLVRIDYQYRQHYQVQTT